MNLSDQQKERYLRNIILPEIGENGQEKLLNSKILVIGAGGLGSSAILYLAAAGIGNITIIDDDSVELSNLQRQIIHNFKDLNKVKVQSAAEKITLLNKDVSVKTHQLRINKDNLSNFVKNHDFILDCSDNFPTRFIINEICFLMQKPLVFAAVKGFLGQVSVFKPYLKNNPCYCCFNPNIVKEGFELPLSQKGIIGAVAGTIGSLQATTAIKEILEIGESLVGKILIFDLLQNNIRKVNLNKNINCQICKLQ
ncbi:HesA/MoeB/ThiF family protein [Rickettsiales bacterium]|nr:HesA/MoeB/ThiF family protein [Rickettsiales bacterium]